MNQYIELISEGKTGDFRYAVLDFDGTISLIREGWQQIMTPYLASGTDEVYVLGEARP